MAIAIKAENISKQYRLGYVGSGSLKDDAIRWWARMRGKEDPLLNIGETNDRSIKGESDYVWALKDINFEIEQGDTVGIIGRNGAGKSTLLKLLSKVTSPTTGNIKVKGRIASLLEVGTGFHPELTGRENIYLNGAIMGMRKHEITRKLDEIVDFAGVERYLDTPVKRYSSGMYVRLGFAVAAHLENEILIVDEVLAVGDAEFQQKCLGKLGNVSKEEGRTVILVSHNLGSVATLCKKAIYIKQGYIEQFDLTSKIIEAYINNSNSGSFEINSAEIKYKNTCPYAHVNSVRIYSKGKSSDTVDISDEIEVQMEFTVTEENTKINPSFHLLDKNGTCILSTFNGPSATLKADPFYGTSLKKGLYSTKLIIPANFLNESVYRINAFLVPPDYNNMAIIEDALQFNVVDSGSMRKEYIGHWIGQIRPKMLWETKYLG